MKAHMIRMIGRVSRKGATTVWSVVWWRLSALEVVFLALIAVVAILWWWDRNVLVPMLTEFERTADMAELIASGRR